MININDIHAYFTRNNRNFYIDIFHRNYMDRSVFYKGLEMFNQLPTTLKDCKMLNEFRSKLCKYVVHHFPN